MRREKKHLCFSQVLLAWPLNYALRPNGRMVLKKKERRERDGKNCPCRTLKIWVLNESSAWSTNLICPRDKDCGVTLQNMPSFSPNTKYVITGPQRIAPWVFAGGLQLDKDEVGPGLAGALCLKADTLPPPVAGAPSSKLLPHRLALARHAHLVSSVELHGLLLEHAGLSESRDFVPVLLRASALHPAAAGLLQVFTFLTSVGRWMENSPRPPAQTTTTFSITG